MPSNFSAYLISQYYIYEQISSSNLGKRDSKATLTGGVGSPAVGLLAVSGISSSWLGGQGYWSGVQEHDAAENDPLFI
jgi:hypothetical protein